MLSSSEIATTFPFGDDIGPIVSDPREASKTSTCPTFPSSDLGLNENSIKPKNTYTGSDVDGDQCQNLEIHGDSTSVVHELIYVDTAEADTSIDDHHSVNEEVPGCVMLPRPDCITHLTTESSLPNSAENDSMGLIPCSWRTIGSVSSPNRDNRLLVPVKVGDRQATALMDSGAAISMVHRKWLDDNGIEIDEKLAQVVFGFGAGSEVQVIGMVTLKLQIHGLSLAPTAFHVIDCQMWPNVSFVLASDFLTENKLCLNLKRKMIRQKLIGEAIVEYYVPGLDSCHTVYRKLPCYAIDTIWVPHNEFIRIQVESHPLVDFTQYCVECPCEPDPLVFRGDNDLQKVEFVSGLVSESSFYVLAMGRNNKEKITKGDRIGYLNTIVSLEPLCLSGEVFVTTHGSSCLGDQMSLDLVESVAQSSNLTEEQKEQVVGLLNEKRAVFSSGDMDIGRMGAIEHNIELWDDTPIYQKPRRLSEPIAREIEEQCHELELLDIIEPSSASWSSPIVPVRKKDGGLRLCIDYRKLNAVTKPDRFPLPNLTDAVFGLYGVKYFSSLDLVRGYYQLPLGESSREYTAFSTPHGHYQFKRLSFGLKNAPAAFQREMQHVLSGFSRSKVIVYIDDVLIMSNTFAEHLALVHKVLSTLDAHGIKVKIQKCRWFVKEIEYLGHVVGTDGIRKSESYVKKVIDVPRPITIRQLREFLGLVNFQRKFVPNFSAIQKPLTEKTSGRGSRKLVWTEAMVNAFEQLKTKIQEDVSLTFPDFSPEHEPLELYVDASASGSGACLCQKQGDHVKVIAYASTSFSASEANYSTIERELSALRWGVKTFRPFLIGMEFILHTDHQPLIYLNNMKLVDSRLARTLEDLADFNFEIRYTPGRENAAADCLSRLYDPQHVHLANEVLFTPGLLPSGLYLSREVPGGGDSLFESLQTVTERNKLLIDPAASPLQLRTLLVGQLSKFPERYGLKLNRLERKKLRLMNYQGQLPGVEVLFAFGALFGCAVYVHYGGKKPVVYLPPNANEDREMKRIHLQCLAGIHYNPLYEMQHYVDAGPNKRIRAGTIVEPIAEPLENVCESDSEGIDVMFSSDVSETSIWCPLHRATHATNVMVQVNKQKCCALLDTGAQVSCISYTLFSSLAIPMDTSVQFVLSGFGNQTSFALGMVRLAIGLINSYHGPYIHKYVVVEDETMPFCLILGADYLVAHDISLDYATGQYIQSGQVIPGKFIDEQVSNEARMVATLTVIELESCIPTWTGEVCIGTEFNHLTLGVEHDKEGHISSLSSLVSPDEIKNLQKQSCQLRTLKRTVSNACDTWPISLSRFKRYREFIVLEDGIIVYKSQSGSLTCVVSFNFLVEISLVIHYQLAHIGRTKLIEALRKLIWHPSLAKVAGDVTRTCDVCQRFKVGSIVSPPMYKIATSLPFELVSLDLVSLPASRGCIGCLVVMDHHTKWLTAVPIRNKTSATVASAFEHRVLPFLPQMPLKILTDNGPEFVGSQFNAVLKTYGILHQYTTPNKPSSNGLVERANRTLLELLRVQSNSPISWYEVLPRALITHNSTYHSALGESPSDFIFGQEHPCHRNIIVSQNTREEWRQGHPAFGSFKFGQLVLRKTVLRGNENKNKFSQRFEGPYLVDQIHQNGVTYKLRDTITATEVRAHHSQLRPYYLPPKYITNHPYHQSLMKDVDQDLYCDSSVVEEDLSDYSGPFQGRACCSSDDSLSFEGFSVEKDSMDMCGARLCELQEPIGYASADGSCALDIERRCTDVPLLEVSASVPLWDLNILEQVLRSVSAELTPLYTSSVCGSPTRMSDVGDRSFMLPASCELPTSYELPSGIILDHSVDFWDVSAIEVSDSQDVIVDTINDTLIEDGFGLLNENIDLLQAIIDSSCSPFSGFDEDGHGENDMQGQLSSVELHLEHVNKKVLNRSKNISAIVSTSQGKLIELRNSVDERRKSARIAKRFNARGLQADESHSPVSTRSMGAARDLPHVMPRVLEYDCSLLQYHKL